jgi:hypothetical protein
MFTYPECCVAQSRGTLVLGDRDDRDRDNGSSLRQRYSHVLRIEQSYVFENLCHSEVNCVTIGSMIFRVYEYIASLVPLSAKKVGNEVFLVLVKYQAIKMYVRVKMKRHTFLISAINCGVQSA